MGGGAMYTWFADSVSIINTKFTGNTAGSYGGAMLSYSSTRGTNLLISNSDLISNYAGSLAGGAYLYNVRTNITKTNVFNNSGSTGGALYFRKSYLAYSNIASSAFINNTARYAEGGALII